jgi:putative FmdB family regulatory protein
MRLAADYECQACGHVWEVEREVSAPPVPPICPHCHSTDVLRRYDAPAIVWRGGKPSDG